MTHVTSSDRLDGAIENYMQTQGDGTSPVSMSRASRAIRMVVSDCPASGSELQNLIAASAIKHGYNVHFDLGDPVDELPAFHV
jgi:hypothetical protein